jgi:hypothetical protein
LTEREGKTEEKQDKNENDASSFHQVSDSSVKRRGLNRADK